MKPILIIFLSFLTGSLYLYSCANRTVPTGGPKDTIPPRLINAVPKNKSLNFRGDKIVLVFDEFIKTKEITNQLIVTPRLGGGAFTHKINKTTLTLDLNERLDTNTTYTFYFQESVQDINESTPAKDLVLAFSTGDYIDSLMIEGKVLDLLNNKPLENIVVALYPANDTLDIFNSKPQYFTRSKKSGDFRIENLKNSSYRIYAFDDVNKNLIAQSDSERYGFISDTIHLDSSLSDVTIPLIKRNVKPFTIQSARPNGVYFEIKMNKYIDSYTITPLTEGVDSVVSNFLPDQNTVRFYKTVSIDSLRAEFTAVDTIGQEFIDTVTIKWQPTQRKPDPIMVTITPTSNSAVDPNFEATVTFNKPTEINNLDSAFIYYDSLTIDSIQLKDLSWNKFHDELTIKKTLDPSRLVKETPVDSIADPSISSDTITTQAPSPEIQEEVDSPGNERNQRKGRQPKEPPVRSKFSKTDNQVILYFAQGTFISVENDTISDVLSVYGFKKNEDTGLIKGALVTDYDYFTIQLLDKDFEVVKEVRNRKAFSFNLIPPGEYRLRILIDNDQDGEWFPGNILENRMPEDVYFYTEPVIIRANWERDLESIILENEG